MSRFSGPPGSPSKSGVGAEAAARSLAPYLHHRRTGRPLCLLKTAASIDGRTAAADGTSQWITGPEARADAHRLRAESGAVVVGAGTALADNPTLTFRNLEFEDGLTPPQPLRVLIDAAGRVPATGPLFDPALAPTLVITIARRRPGGQARLEGEPEPRLRRSALTPAAGPGQGGVDLQAALELLGRRGILQAMVEGGATLHGALLGAGLVDRIVVYVGGAVLGAGGPPGVRRARVRRRSARRRAGG